jgi:hypothetical protein
MTTGLMRRSFSSSSRVRLSRLSPFASTHLATPQRLGLKQYQRTITDVRARQASVARTWFTSSSVLLYPGGEPDHKPPDEYKLKLGKSRLYQFVPDIR